MIQNAGIVGLGALGILFGQKLTEALGKEQVYVFADKERIDRYRKFYICGVEGRAGSGSSDLCHKILQSGGSCQE